MDGGRERERQDALVAAVGALRRRERTVAEMHAWLIERGIPTDVVDDVISDLIEVGELDDDRFAHAFAADKRELSGWGSARIEAALVDRGLERSLAETAAQEDRDEQVERAASLVLARHGVPEDEPDRARALLFLTRRGYDYELAYDALRRVESDDRRAA